MASYRVDLSILLKFSYDPPLSQIAPLLPESSGERGRRRAGRAFRVADVLMGGGPEQRHPLAHPEPPGAEHVGIITLSCPIH